VRLSTAAEEAIGVFLTAVSIFSSIFVLVMILQQHTFRLYKSEWVCAKSHTEIELIPVTQHDGSVVVLPLSTEICDRYERVENVSDNGSEEPGT
jgi:hypothetical protein